MNIITFILTLCELGIHALTVLTAIMKVMFVHEPLVQVLFGCLEILLTIIGGIVGIFVILSGISDNSSKSNNNISSTSGEAKPPPCQVDSKRSNKNEAHSTNEAPKFVSDDDTPVSSNITSLSTENISSVSTTIFNSTWSGENKLMVEPPDKDTE